MFGWLKREKAPDPAWRDGVTEAATRTPDEWRARLAAARLAREQARDDWRRALDVQEPDDVLVDLLSARAEWRASEYGWLLASALRHGQLDNEDYHAVTGELPVSALGWMRCS